MDEIDKHQTILNAPMNNFWKGLFFTLITAFIAYPILRFELTIVHLSSTFDYFLVFVLPIVWLLKLVLIVICFYASVGYFREKKQFNLLPMVISFLTLLVTIFT